MNPRPDLDALRAWIAHAREEESVHVSIPVTMAEAIVAELAMARESDAILRAAEGSEKDDGT